MKKNFLSYFCVVAIIVTIFPASAFAADLDEILQRGVIRVGMYNQDPRMFLDPETNELKGLEPDTAAAFAKALGVELEIVQTEWDALIPSLIADKFDIIIANMGRLPSRAAVVDFTLAFENYDGTCIAVRKNEDKIKGWEDFKKGVKVGTGRGNVAEAYTKNTYPDIDMVPFASPQLAIQALVAGQVDCVVEDYTAMVSFAKEFDAIKLVATDPLVNVKMTGFAIKPGNFRLWLWANIFLIDFKNSGEHAKLWYKWFPDIPIVKAPFEIN